eukprot:5705976-Lingulodinium_polyedra.AAC.1
MPVGFWPGLRPPRRTRPAYAPIAAPRLAYAVCSATGRPALRPVWPERRTRHVAGVGLRPLR